MTLQEIKAELAVLAEQIENLNVNEYGVPLDQDHARKLLDREEELFNLLGLNNANLLIA